jgi:integrase
MRHKLPPRVHRKVAKGREYLYYDTGKTTLAGKAIRVPLPPFGDSGFWPTYNSCERDRNGADVENALTVAGLCEKFRNSPRYAKLAPNSKASYETYMKVIVEMFDTFLAHQVEPQDVSKLLEKLKDRPGAANQCVRTLSAVYAWGCKPANALVAKNPAAGIELYEGGEHEPWPEWLLEEALKAKDPFIRLTVNLLYYGGQRIGDTCAMGWRKIIGDYEYMTVKQEKTDEELDIRIHGQLRAVLRETPRSLGTIIRKADGTRYSVGHVRQRLQEWAEKRGVEVVPHGLRKNAVNGLLEAGCSAAHVSSITGQSLQMVEHYAKKRDRKRLSDAAVLLWEQKADVKTS